jgi:hypothetical protein
MRWCVLRRVANTNAEQREADSGADQRVFEGQCGNQFHGREQSGGIRVGAGRTRSAGVCRSEQDEAGRNQSVRGAALGFGGIVFALIEFDAGGLGFLPPIKKGESAVRMISPYAALTEPILR